MKDNQAKYPQLRFKGFTDPWERRKLANVVSISAGGDVDKTKLIENGGYPVLANALTNSGIVGYYDSYKVEAPAVTVTGRGDVGHAVARHVNFTPVVRLLSLKSEVLDADFLANMLNQTNILVESTGVPQLTAPQLGSYKILYPNLNEQTKIGKLLNAFDNLIALHQRKLAKLKELKQGYLQKLFPKNGSKFPQLRFAGFADAWEQRKLGDLADFNPKSVLPETFEYVDLESVVGTDIISHRLEHKDSAPSRAQRLAQKGDVFYQTVRPYQKNNCIFDKLDNDWVFSTGYAQLRPKKDSYFLLVLLQNNSFMRKVLGRCTGTSYPAINSKDLAQIKVSISDSIDEQKKIGNLFRNIDNTITLHQRKLEKLQELKKGYLQKMFC
ncbi:restriction endonuclease subunit S [Pediococcus pentosaceus]|uniref:restriction endonuclease subunit S n=1 Tax=Pediococcus pentosaceus TaxID=1255 RepID=UPI000B4BD93C|nr:restriction endonuclease subunit S [Pediococcus pentosaceus]ASC09365.1 Type I site-specific deoxyribonuclease [Pediococcus pentosaceus]